MKVGMFAKIASGYGVHFYLHRYNRPPEKKKKYVSTTEPNGSHDALRSIVHAALLT